MTAKAANDTWSLVHCLRATPPARRRGGDSADELRDALLVGTHLCGIYGSRDTAGHRGQVDGAAPAQDIEFRAVRH